MNIIFVICRRGGIATSGSDMMSRRHYLSSLLVFLLISILESQMLATDSVVENLGDYCDTEVFHAECSDREVILMRAARYGRMRVGRCVEYDLGYIDCYTDVLLLMDRRCSGRRTCEIRVPDAEFESTGPCLKELKTYLEVSYICVPVDTASNEYCSAYAYVNLTSPVGYISSQMTSDAPACDHTKYPWVILARPGQRINLTLYDFAVEGGGVPLQNPVALSRDGGSRICRQYGWMADSGLDRQTPICATDRRVSDIYSSKGHTLKIWTVSTVISGEQKNFLIRYKVSGCPDPAVLPDHTWFERGSDGLANVGCHNGPVRWLMQCIDDVWTGHVGNCSSAHKARADDQFDSADEMTIPYGLAIGVGAVIGVMIATVIVLIVGFSKRQTERRNAMDRQLQQQKRCSSLSVHHLEQIYSKSPNQQDPSSGAIYVQQTLKSDHPADRSLTPEDESHIKHVCGQQQQQLKQQHHLLLHHHQQQQSLSAESKIYQTERIWESPLTRLTQPIGAQDTGNRCNVTGSRCNVSTDRVFTVVALQDPDIRFGTSTGNDQVTSSISDRTAIYSTAARTNTCLNGCNQCTCAGYSTLD